jgi:hypothetical protein
MLPEYGASLCPVRKPQVDTIRQSFEIALDLKFDHTRAGSNNSPIYGKLMRDS